MLKQLGVISDANALYMDYALNGVPSSSGTLTWDDGGLQEFVIQHWADQNPSQAANLQLNIHWCSMTVSYTDGHYAWEDTDIRSLVADYLADGWQVGIGMWPLAGDGKHYGGHALTIQDVLPQSAPPSGTFIVTDSDRDNDWSILGDVNTYADWTYGPSAYNGHEYYAWFNDFYSGDLNYWPDGDIGYVVAVFVPEPNAWVMLCGLALAWYALRHRKHFARLSF